MFCKKTIGRDFIVQKLLYLPTFVVRSVYAQTSHACGFLASFNIMIILCLLNKIEQMCFFMVLSLNNGTLKNI